MALNVVSNAGPLMVFSKLIAPALSKNALLLMDEERGRDYVMQKNLHCFDSVYSEKEVL
jgi:Pyruvate/2-oxoacid:ferredoxin oxidoreductase gamma subunit